MANIEKVIKGLESQLDDLSKYADEDELLTLTQEQAREIVTLLKGQKVRELTIDEWREWKTNPKRDPICELWENDTSPMWILDPDKVHEPALLMGKLKLFNGKPSFEQCKEVKWNECSEYQADRHNETDEPALPDDT